MQLTDLIQFVTEYGAVGLFLCIWLVMALPIPDEAAVMIGGTAAASHLLSPAAAFAAVYLGVISALTAGYVCGRLMGAALLPRLRMNAYGRRFVDDADQRLVRLGPLYLSVSYLLPVVRHLIPCMAGISKMSYSRFCSYSYPAGFIWTLLWFSVGYSLDKAVPSLVVVMQNCKWLTLCLFAAILLIGLAVNRVRRSKSHVGRTHSRCRR